jgi:hypothetical protein
MSHQGSHQCSSECSGTAKATLEIALRKPNTGISGASLLPQLSSRRQLTLVTPQRNRWNATPICSNAVISRRSAVWLGWGYQLSNKQATLPYHPSGFTRIMDARAHGHQSSIICR